MFRQTTALAHLIIRIIAVTLLAACGFVTVVWLLANNCTGGDADLAYVSLVSGVSAASAGMTALSRSGFVIRVVLFPLCLVFLLPLWPLGRILAGWAGHGRSACETLLGLPYPADGGETIQAPVAFTLYALTAAMIAVTMLRARVRQ